MTHSTSRTPRTWLPLLGIGMLLVGMPGCDPENGDDDSDRAGLGKCESSVDDDCDENADDGDDGDDHEQDTDCGDDEDTDGDDEDTDGDEGEADLPYDMKLELGDVVLLEDAFLEKGPLPAAVLEVTMEDGDWRLLELANGIPFAVTQADCDHEGNRDTGRDRIFVTWENGDGSTETDHLDLRYCED